MDEEDLAPTDESSARLRELWAKRDVLRLTYDEIHELLTLTTQLAPVAAHLRFDAAVLRRMAVRCHAAGDNARAARLRALAQSLVVLAERQDRESV